MSVRDRRKRERRHREVKIALERRGVQRRVTTDRRSSRRLELELWMEEVSGDDVYFRRAGNVGEGGVFFDRAIPHALGTIVTLKFALPGDKEMLVARGEVVSTAEGDQGLGMGVKFLSIEGDGRKRLRTFIRAS